MPAPMVHRRTFNRSRLAVAALAIAAVLGPVAAGCALPRYGKPPPDPAGGLFLLERDLFAALQKKDAAALKLLLADDFTLRAPGSPDVDREKFIAGVLAIQGTLEVTGDGVDARVIGDVGVITGVQRGRVKLDDGRSVDDVQVFTDVAIYRDGRWQIALAHSTVRARWTGQ